MPQATIPDGVKLYYEEVGSGTPILFVHEYSGDWRSWASMREHESSCSGRRGRLGHMRIWHARAASSPTPR